MSTVIVSNPRGYRVQQNMALLLATLGRLEMVEHCVTNDLDALDAVLTGRAWTKQDLVVINGGDGSVQHLLTRLFALCSEQSLPRFAVLPGGTTNMTALAFNHSRSYRSTLLSLERALQSGQQDIQQRKLLQVRHAGKQLTGVFFGAAAVVSGIEYFHQRLLQRRARSQWGVAMVVLRAAWGMTRRQPPFAEPTRMKIGDSETYAALILLVTSLDRLILGIRPFWGQQQGALNLTLIEQRASHFLRIMPRLLRGKPGRALQPENGYHSHRLDQVELTLDGPFTIDGEIFGRPEQPIQLVATDPISVLTL